MAAPTRRRVAYMAVTFTERVGDTSGISRDGGSKVAIDGYFTERGLADTIIAELTGKGSWFTEVEIEVLLLQDQVAATKS